MLLKCTPGVLASHLLAAIAVADQISLDELWVHAREKLATDFVDDFQKNIIWRALAPNAGVLFVVRVSGREVPGATTLSYAALQLHAPDHSIAFSPTDKCKYLYLAGTTNYHKLVANLGEKPLQMLAVIARHGADGILNGQLAQESGQDIRSIGMRLQKLEAAGLVICRSVYVDKKHTNHLMHVRFAPDSLVAKQNAEVVDDICMTRDVKRTKTVILDALLHAPNRMRGFADLKKDLRLDRSVSEEKFFKAVCNKLHHGGYLEKVQVELPQTKQRVYALRFIRDIGDDTADGAVDDSGVADETGDAGDDNVAESEDAGSNVNETVSAVRPSFNLVFPPFHQMFHEITVRGAEGAKIGEIFKSMLGIADFRPFSRLFEVLPTYLSNSKTLKPYKKYAEPYDEYLAAKLYDHEGRIKFYRYFVTSVCKETRPKPAKYVLAPKSNKHTLQDLEWRLKTPVGRISTDAILSKRKRLLAAAEEAPTKRVKAERNDAIDVTDATERVGRAKKAEMAESASEEKLQLSLLPPTQLAQMAIDEQDARPRRARKALSYAEKTLRRRMRKSALRAARTPSSLSSLKRRTVLVQILEDEGGAAIANSALRKTLDARLSKTCETDNKTLMRDVAALVEDGVLETRPEDMGPSLRQTPRTVLVLTSHKAQLTEEHISALKARLLQQNSKKGLRGWRVVESELSFHHGAPKPLANAAVAAKRRIHVEKRIRAFRNAHETRVEIETSSTPAPDTATPAEVHDVFGPLRLRRKARKLATPVAAEAPVLGAKRPRRSLKLEKTHTTTIYRAVIVHRAFSRDAVDFGKIAQLICESDKELVRRKWGTLRRQFGGSEAVRKGVETFQHMVMQGIADGEISVADVEAARLDFFLDFWRRFDVSAELAVADDMPLYALFAQNQTCYDVLVRGEAAPELAERIEDASMRQKESMLASTLFAKATEEKELRTEEGREKKSETEAAPSISDRDELRSVLKSILSIDDGELNSAAAKEILTAYDANLVQRVADSMIRSREMALVYADERKKFVLSERFHHALSPRVLGARFFHEATAMRELLASVTRARKGLILSPGMTPGEMAALLQLVSDHQVDFMRIDRALKVDSYESRLIDREQIGCDLIAHTMIANAAPVRVSPVPVVGPCRPLWANLSLTVNTDLWTRVVVAIMYHVVFKPGLTRAGLHTRLCVALNSADLDLALGWLAANGCVEERGGFTATSSWQYVLGC
ncbi:hypothetical protein METBISCDRAFT_12273 [Metschnikowia bicuspidata]|uniref:Uncharacterized protein n=1 Tax=Metschnikowia bicuspidata TaxID=27322 RepID=A0A4P9ZJP4_9ASCO|nr:hypothetical protein METBISCDRAFT_12273 [Metschnikowia bicuspidata]